jgi:hypothetical protein
MEPDPGKAVLPGQRVPVIRLMHVPEKRYVKHTDPIINVDYSKSRIGNNPDKYPVHSSRVSKGKMGEEAHLKTRHAGQGGVIGGGLV